MSIAVLAFKYRIYRAANISPVAATSAPTIREPSWLTAPLPLPGVVLFDPGICCCVALLFTILPSILAFTGECAWI